MEFNSQYRVFYLINVSLGSARALCNAAFLHQGNFVCECQLTLTGRGFPNGKCYNDTIMMILATALTLTMNYCAMALLYLLLAASLHRLFGQAVSFE